MTGVAFKCAKYGSEEAGKEIVVFEEAGSNARWSEWLEYSNYLACGAQIKYQDWDNKIDNQGVTGLAISYCYNYKY